MRKPRNRQPFSLLIPRGNRGCYPPGPDAADSDCYPSDADLDDGCYGSAEALLRSLILPRRPRPRPRPRRR